MKYFFLVDVFLLSSKSSSWQMPQKIDFFSLVTYLLLLQLLCLVFWLSARKEFCFECCGDDKSSKSKNISLRALFV